MEEKTSGSFYGGSLIVPSVQELAKKPITVIPARYIQPHHHEQQGHVMFNPDHDHAEIPFIDMQKLLSQESTDSESELAKLHFACKEWGFFQLVNHGVSSSLMDKVKTEIQDFFNLAMEDKKKLWQTPRDVEGFGQAFVVSEDQKLDWADIFFMTTLPVEMRRPHLFPNVPSPFRETLEVYSLEVKNLAMTILSQMETALQMEAKELTKLFEDGMQSMRMNYYPPCPLPAEVIGLTPHSDSVGLTILLQVNEMDGLQVKKDGIWVPVKPLPDAFIVNIGDVLEIQTNGIYRSIEHRATVNSVKERLSIATFHNPGPDGEIGPASSLVTEQTPAVYKRVGVQDYVKALFERKLQGKSFLDELGIK
ncbi:protein SRG1-like [Prunus yedoensis var. nudiflora]|uniref:Protein SRG1-like n=2 Tax=Prunus yedoensis var. nudiflora TaxID=2094558 RepID=A0A314ZJZ0_PRUYE|nr:protein SRG1-like [Prunus yedoensis var. nudiflora]